MRAHYAQAILIAAHVRRKITLRNFSQKINAIVLSPIKPRLPYCGARGVSSSSLYNGENRTVVLIHRLNDRACIKLILVCSVEMFGVARVSTVALKLSSPAMGGNLCRAFLSTCFLLIFRLVVSCAYCSAYTRRRRC